MSDLTDNIKAGWKTSEFWISIITAVLGGGVLTGFITPSESNEMLNVLAGISGIIPTIAYIFSRGKAKEGVDINAILAIISAAATQQNEKK